MSASASGEEGPEVRAGAHGIIPHRPAPGGAERPPSRPARAAPATFSAPAASNVTVRRALGVGAPGKRGGPRERGVRSAAGAGSTRQDGRGTMSTTRAAAVGMQRTDEELVALATAGDPDSFNQLIVRWERSIFALAFRVLGREEDARDVCQETFLRAFRGIRGFKGQSKFSSWLYRIALNLCRDWMRRERRSASLAPLDESTEPASWAGAAPPETAEDHAVRQDLKRVITRAMSALSEDQRITIVLKEYHGLTFQEIADLQGCPLSTVKTRLYQGLGVLRRHLQRDGVRGAADLGRRAAGPRPAADVGGASRQPVEESSRRTAPA